MQTQNSRKQPQPRSIVVVKQHGNNKTKSATNSRNNTNATPPTVTRPKILSKDPIKVKENEQFNEERIKELIKQYSQSQKPKKEKKEKKKWYDSVLQTAENIIPSLLPYLPMVLGMGDYTEEDAPLVSQKMPETNTLLAHISKGKVGNEVPYVHSEGDAIRIPHREYIGDLYSSLDSFRTELLRINPGLDEIFEWLGPIATQFTSYRLGGALIEFVSTGSDYSNAAGLGYVGVAAQYNSSELPFSNKDEMLNSQFANMDKPSKSFATWIECAEEIVGKQPKFVRTGDLPPNADINLYDHCMVTIACGGNTEANAIIGSIYITYDIELMIPRPRSSATINLSEYVINDVTNSAPLGSFTYSRIKQDSATFPLTFTNVGDSVLFPKTIRKGKYLVVIRYDSENPVSGVSVPVPTGTNATVYNTFVGYMGNGGSGSEYAALIFYIDLSTNQTPNESGFTLSTPSVIADGTCTAYLTVTQLPDQFTSSDPSVIFDYHGRNRETRYQDFMKKFKETPPPEWTLFKKFKTFSLFQKATHEELLHAFKVSDAENYVIIDPRFFNAILNSTNPDLVVQNLQLLAKHQ